MIARYLWMTLGWLCIALGALGAVLPLLPTTPFLLLSAYAFSKGSARWHAWLMAHPKLGPPIAHWQQHRAIARRTKVMATAALLTVSALAWLAKAPLWVLGLQSAILLCVCAFLWTRKEAGNPPEQSD